MGDYNHNLLGNIADNYARAADALITQIENGTLQSAEQFPGTTEDALNNAREIFLAQARSYRDLLRRVSDMNYEIHDKTVGNPDAR